MQFKLNHWIKIGLIAAFFLVLIAIFGIRYSNNASLLISDYSYMTLSIRGETTGVTAYANFLLLLFNNFGEFSLIAIQFIEMAVIFFIINLIMKKVGISLEARLLSFLAICFCPAILWHTAVINSNIFIILVFVISMLVFLYNPVAGFIISLLLLLLSPFHFFILISIYLLYSKKTFLGILACIAPFGFFFLKTPVRIENFIFELGSINGFTVGLIIFAVAGIFTLGNRLKNQPGFLVLLFALIIKSMLTGADLVLLVPLLLFGVSGMEDYLSRKWSYKGLQIATLIFIFATLIIPFIFAFGNLISSPPDEYDILSLSSLKGLPKGNVLAPKELGFTAQFISEKLPVIDSMSANKRTINETTALLKSRNLDNTKKLLSSLNVKYIWISPHTNSKTWSGLMFMLRNRETFREIYSKEGHKIYQVLR